MSHYMTERPVPPEEPRCYGNHWRPGDRVVRAVTVFQHVVDGVVTIEWAACRGHAREMRTASYYVKVFKT